MIYKANAEGSTILNKNENKLIIILKGKIGIFKKKNDILNSKKMTKNDSILKLFELFIPKKESKNGFFQNTEIYLENDKKDFIKFFNLVNKKGSNIEIIGFYKNYKLFKKENHLFEFIENNVLNKKIFLNIEEINNLEIKFGKIKNIIDVNKFYYYDYDNNKRLFFDKFITLENSEYLVIKNPKVLKIINKLIKKKNDFLIKFFLRSFGLEKRKSTVKIMNRLLQLYKKRKFSKNETIIKQGEKGSKIFIIKKGNFVINYKIIEKENKLLNNLNFGKNEMEKIKNKDVKINICKKFELIGEEIFFKNNYCFNIKSLCSNSEVFEFDKSIIKFFSEEMKNSIYDLIKKKIKIRKQNLKNNLNIILENDSFKEKKKKMNFKFLNIEKTKKVNLGGKILDKISRLSLKKFKCKINDKKYEKLNKKKNYNEFCFLTQRKFTLFKPKEILSKKIVNFIPKISKSNSPQKKTFSNLLNKSHFLIKSFKKKNNNFIIRNLKTSVN